MNDVKEIAAALKRGGSLDNKPILKYIEISIHP